MYDIVTCARVEGNLPNIFILPGGRISAGNPFSNLAEFNLNAGIRCLLVST